jgi:hypothetical protein
MKRTFLLEITIAIALTAILTMTAGIIANLIPTLAFNGNAWLLVGVFFVILTIPGTIVIILQTAHEKRANKPDEDKPTVATKDISTRFILREGPVTIEVPDAESAIKMLQVILNGKSSLKVESGLTIEVKEPEERDAPETKGDEE